MKERITMSNSHKYTQMRSHMESCRLSPKCRLNSSQGKFMRQSFNINTESPFDGQQNQSSKQNLNILSCLWVLLHCGIQFNSSPEPNAITTDDEWMDTFVCDTDTFYSPSPWATLQGNSFYGLTGWRRRVKIWIAINCKFHGEILCSFCHWPPPQKHSFLCTRHTLSDANILWKCEFTATKCISEEHVIQSVQFA